MECAGQLCCSQLSGLRLHDWSPDSHRRSRALIQIPIIEGYVYMAGASNEWKIATQHNWNGPNYGAGATAGTLNSKRERVTSFRLQAITK